MQSSFITHIGQRPTKSGHVDNAIESGNGTNVGSSELPLCLRICILGKFHY